MEKEQLKRGKNRIIGGVCSTLAEQYNIELWILRVGLIIISIYFYSTVFAYLIAWISIPNEVKVESKKQNRVQIIGLVIGGILGALSFGGFTFFAALIMHDPGNGGIAPILLAFMGIPVGMVIGFSITRMTVEKKALQNNQEN